MKRFSTKWEEEEENGKNRLAKQNFITKNANKMQHLLSLWKLLKLDLSQR